MSSEWSLPFRLPTETLYAFLISPMHGNIRNISQEVPVHQSYLYDGFPTQGQNFRTACLNPSHRQWTLCYAKEATIYPMNSFVGIEVRITFKRTQGGILYGAVIRGVSSMKLNGSPAKGSNTGLQYCRAVSQCTGLKICFTLDSALITSCFRLSLKSMLQKQR